MFTPFAGSWAGSFREFQTFLSERDYSYCEKLGVDPLIPLAIAGVESNWTPWVIRVNTKKRITVKGEGIKTVRGRGYYVFYCKSRAKCEALALLLLRKGIKNLDLGAFQFNYYHQKKIDKDFTVFDAFDLKEAYRRVCRIVALNFQARGKTANAVAMYHTSRPWKNYYYAKKFWRIYKKLRRQLERAD